MYLMCFTIQFCHTHIHRVHLVYVQHFLYHTLLTRWNRSISTRINRCNITNNHIVPVDQTSREQFLGNTISRVWWVNNITNIGCATLHSPGNCVRNYIRYFHEYFPLQTLPSSITHITIHGAGKCYYEGNCTYKSIRSWALTSARGEFKADVVQLLLRVPERRDKGVWLHEWYPKFQINSCCISLWKKGAFKRQSGRTSGRKQETSVVCINENDLCEIGEVMMRWASSTDGMFNTVAPQLGIHQTWKEMCEITVLLTNSTKSIFLWFELLFIGFQGILELIFRFYSWLLRLVMDLHLSTFRIFWHHMCPGRNLRSFAKAVLSIPQSRLRTKGD